MMPPGFTVLALADPALAPPRDVTESRNDDTAGDVRDRIRAADGDDGGTGCSSTPGCLRPRGRTRGNDASARAR